METIQYLSKINEVDTDRIRELIGLETFTRNDIEKLEDILNEFINYINFLKTMIKIAQEAIKGIIFENHEEDFEINE